MNCSRKFRGASPIKWADPGDMVNFLIIGTQDAMEKVFTTAGWVKVDANVRETVLNGFLASMSRNPTSPCR